MSSKPTEGISTWLSSWFKTSLLAVRSSPKNPYLEVAYRRGQLVLNSRRANYSYGELQQVWLDAFQEVGLAARQPRTALLLGLGAGGTARWLADHCLGCQITGVEWDPTVVELANAYFELNQIQGLTTVVADATVWIATPPATYDLVLIDLFTELQVPDVANDEAFMKYIYNALNMNGMIMFNRIMINECTDANKRAWVSFTNTFSHPARVKTHVNEVWHAIKHEPNMS